MTNADIAATINRQIEQIRWQKRAHGRVSKRNLNVRTVVEAAEIELRALETRLAVLKGHLKKLAKNAVREGSGSLQAGEPC